MFDLPSQENVKEVIIDQDVALGEKEPIVVYSKNKGITDKSSAA